MNPYIKNKKKINKIKNIIFSQFSYSDVTKSYSNWLYRLYIEGTKIKRPMLTNQCEGR